MTTEFTVHAAYGLIVMAMLFVQIGVVIQRRGIMVKAPPRDDTRSEGGLAGGAVPTGESLIAAMALFAPGMLALYIQGAGMPGTEIAAGYLYFMAIRA